MLNSTDVNDVLISLVIPVKNEKGKIKVIIEGLYKQSYRPIEVIFVDGGSTDGTIEEILDAIKKYSVDDFKIILLRESDFGGVRSPANARNIGALNASGEYVAFFDADFDFNEDSRAVENIVRAFNNGANHVGIRYVPNMHTWIEKHLALDDIIHYFKEDKPAHLICAFKREFFNQVRFNPMLGFREDFEFLDRLSRHVKLNTIIVDTNIRRCYPHTFYGFGRQQLWYGRTALRYYRIAGVNPLTTLVRSNAILGLVNLAIIVAPSMWLLSIVLLAFIFLLIYVRWLRRDMKILGIRKHLLERLIWYLFREIVGRVFFDIGFIKSLVQKKVMLGR
jgi:glycosyltransferase involved in cell wall biosynthesis